MHLRQTLESDNVGVESRSLFSYRQCCLQLKLIGSLPGKWTCIYVQHIA